MIIIYHTSSGTADCWWILQRFSHSNSPSPCSTSKKKDDTPAGSGPLIFQIRKRSWTWPGQIPILTEVPHLNTEIHDVLLLARFNWRSCMLLPSTSCGCSKVILYNHNPWSQPDGCTAWREQSPSTCKALVNAGHTEHKNQMVLRWGSYLQTTKSDIRIRSCKSIPVNFAVSKIDQRLSCNVVRQKRSKAHGSSNENLQCWSRDFNRNPDWLRFFLWTLSSKDLQTRRRQTNDT